MWTSGAAAGYRDPTALFDESGFSGSSSSSSTSGSEADYRTLQDLLTAAPGFVTAPLPPPPPSSPTAARWRWLLPGKAQHHRRDDVAEEARRRHQQQQAERRFFKERGALDFQRSAVFEGASDRTAAFPTSSALASTVEVDAWGQPRAVSAPRGQESAFVTTQRGSCVPVELQAWYVASSAAPTATSRAVHRKKRKQSPPRRRSTHDSAAHSADAGSEASSAAVEGTTGTGEDVEPSAFAQVAAEPPIRSSGAGTTSVNVLWTRPAPTHTLRQAPRASAVDTAANDMPSSPSQQRGAAAVPSASTNPFEMGHSDGSGSGADDPAEAATSDSGVDAEADVAVWPTYAGGGLPPLRAHRYVEQPNGVFLDHAVHADLLARYALEEQLRHAHAKQEAHRARRWSRLLHRSGHARARSGGGSGNPQAGTGTAAAASRGAAGRPVRYHWLYDAATYRDRFLSILRYLQRVHVFLVAAVAGLSLLTLIAITIPFPELQAQQVEDGLPGDVAAVLLLALVNTSAAAGAAATAQVLPVAQRGEPTLALFLALLQPYHVSLLLFLCVVAVITGLAPVAWGVAERSWTARRRRWLAQDAANPPHNTHHRRSSHPLVSPTSDTDDGEGFELSSSAATNHFTNRSPFSHTIGSLSLGATTHRAMAATPRARSFSVALPEDGRRRGSAALFGTERSRQQSPQQQQQRLPRRPSPLAQRRATNAAGGRAQKRSAPLHGTYDGLHDPMRNSVSFGMNRSVSVVDLLQGYDVANSSLAELPTAYLSGTATMTGFGGSPTASLADTSLPQVPHPYARHGRGRSTNPHSLSGSVGNAAAASTWERASGSGGAAGRSALLPPPLYLLPAAPLEGRLSADNVLTRSFDYVQRRAMQWVVNAVHHCGDARGSGGEAPRQPAVPLSLYLHLLLQPRLWCVMAALALTLVELAVVDERSVALLWRTQPASWWASSSLTVTEAREGGMLLPHTWMTATFSNNAAGLSSVDVGAATLPRDSAGADGKDGQIILGIYAARTAVIWVAWLLNVFF